MAGWLANQRATVLFSAACYYRFNLLLCWDWSRWTSIEIIQKVVRQLDMEREKLGLNGLANKIKKIGFGRWFFSTSYRDSCLSINLLHYTWYIMKIFTYLLKYWNLCLFFSSASQGIKVFLERVLQEFKPWPVQIFLLRGWVGLKRLMQYQPLDRLFTCQELINHLICILISSCCH